jgi:ribosomal protein S18 acetylase RimI-like enzyme
MKADESKMVLPRARQLLLLSGYVVVSVLAFRSTPSYPRNYQRRRQSSRSLHLTSRTAADDESDVLSATNGKSSDIGPSRYIIQEAKYSHIPQIADIITSSFHPELDTNFFLRPIRVILETDRLQSNFPYSDTNHYYLVILDIIEDKIVGFCDLDFRSPPEYSDVNLFQMFSSSSSNYLVRQRPYLSDLAIHPHHRRRGLASYLMEKAHAYAKQCGELYLGVAEDNKGALAMYYGLGYESLDYYNGSGFGVDCTVRLLRLEL